MRLPWLYKLSLKYIGYCNRKWERSEDVHLVSTLDRLTYRNNVKYYLYYGASSADMIF